MLLKDEKQCYALRIIRKLLIKLLRNGFIKFMTYHNELLIAEINTILDISRTHIFRVSFLLDI